MQLRPRSHLASCVQWQTNLLLSRGFHVIKNVWTPISAAHLAIVAFSSVDICTHHDLFFCSVLCHALLLLPLLKMELQLPVDQQHQAMDFPSLYKTLLPHVPLAILTWLVIHEFREIYSCNVQITRCTAMRNTFTTSVTKRKGSFFLNGT